MTMIETIAMLMLTLSDGTSPEPLEGIWYAVGLLFAVLGALLLASWFRNAHLP
jgi:hypothetical protein